MRLSHFAAFLSLLAVAGVLLLPTAGCGAKKKGAKALTIKQQLEKAEAEGTPDRQAAALLKVAAHNGMPATDLVQKKRPRLHSTS